MSSIDKSFEKIEQIINCIDPEEHQEIIFFMEAVDDILKSLAHKITELENVQERDAVSVHRGMCEI
jgi:hypothetical protein